MYVRERNKVLYFLFLCAGFSKQMVEILNKHNIQFSSFDIFSDEEVRQGLKTYSSWPTYPQLYVSGELIGGLDIIKVRSEKTIVKNFHVYCCLVAKLSLTLWGPHGLQLTRLLCLWDFLDKNTGVGCRFFLQGILPTQGSNLCLLQCQAGSLPLSHQFGIFIFKRTFISAVLNQKYTFL